MSLKEEQMSRMPPVSGGNALGYFSVPNYRLLRSASWANSVLKRQRFRGPLSFFKRMDSPLSLLFVDAPAANYREETSS